MMELQQLTKVTHAWRVEKEYNVERVGCPSSSMSSIMTKGCRWDLVEKMEDSFIQPLSKLSGEYCSDLQCSDSLLNLKQIAEDVQFTLFEEEL